MRARTAFLLVAGLACATANAQTASRGLLAGAGWLATLTGSCWRGEHPNGKGSDTQCYETQYGRFIRGNIRIYDDKGTLLTEGDSVFSPDPRTGRVTYTQWASNGAYGSGELKVDGPVLRFVHRAADGSELKVRFTWTRPDPDSYRVARERRQDDGEWKEEFGVVYRRVAR